MYDDIVRGRYKSQRRRSYSLWFNSVSYHRYILYSIESIEGTMSESVVSHSLLIYLFMTPEQMSTIDARPLIIYGSQTGQSESIAKQLCDRIICELRIDPSLLPYSMDQIETKVVGSSRSPPHLLFMVKECVCVLESTSNRTMVSLIHFSSQSITSHYSLSYVRRRATAMHPIMRQSSFDIYSTNHYRPIDSNISHSRYSVNCLFLYSICSFEFRLR